MSQAQKLALLRVSQRSRCRLQVTTWLRRLLHGRLLLLALLSVLLPALPLLAARDAAMQRGFNSGGVFDTNDVDHINAFNGNLVATIPLGSSFSTPGALSYRFQLVYNSNVWDYIEHTGAATSPEGALANWIDQYRVFVRINGEDYEIHGDGELPAGSNDDGSEAIPARSSNAGLGWIVTLGELQTRSPGNGVPQVVYIGSDAGEHTFYSNLHGAAQENQGINQDFYTRDSSYIRMRIGADPAKRKIHLPDGVIQTFECVHECDKVTGQWVLTEMGDSYGNLLVVTRSGTGNKRPAVGSTWVWTFTEYFSSSPGYKTAGDGDLVEVRQSKLTFRVMLAQGAVSEVRLEEVDLPAFADGAVSRAKYKLLYRVDSEIYRDRLSSWWNFSGGDNLVYPIADNARPDRIKVSLLDAVELPPNSGATAASGQWNLAYYGDDCPDPDSTSCDAAGFFGKRLWKPSPSAPMTAYVVNSVYGRLKHLQLPTGSGMRYTYEGRGYPNTDLCVNSQPQPGRFTRLFGVSRRQRTTPDGDDGIPTLYFGRAYASALKECKPFELVSTVIDPPNVHAGYYADNKSTTESRVTVTYFSINVDPLDAACTGASTECWTLREHGLPISHKRQKVFDGVIRALSNSVYECKTSLFHERPDVELDNNVRRIVDHNLVAGEALVCGQPKRSTWVKYEDSAGYECTSDDLGRCTNANRREASSLTEFYDDKYSVGCSPYDAAGCQPVYTVTDRSEFDGLGHYRRTVTDGNLTNRTSGNSTRSDKRTAYENFNAGTVYTAGTPFTGYPANWILGQSTESFVTQDGASNVKRMQYEAGTGFLLGVRTLKTQLPVQAPGVAALDQADLLMFRERKVVNGRVVLVEYFFGGDAQAIATDADFADPPKGWVYAIERTSRGGPNAPAGVLESVAYKAKCGSAGQDTVIEQTRVDAASGLVLSSTDEFGALTSYRYDRQGRVTRVTPPGEVAIDYTYPNLLSGQRKVQMTRAGGAGVEWEFDGYGRVIFERKDLPDGGAFSRSMVSTEYTMTGLKAITSTVIGNGASEANKRTFYSFDIFGRTVKVVPPGADAMNKKLSYAYEGIREVQRTQDGVSHGGYGTHGSVSITEARDVHGRLIEVVEPTASAQSPPSQVRTRYEYDMADRLLKVVSPAGGNSDRTFTWDGRGLLYEEVHPELAGRKIRWQGYDARGNARQRVLIRPDAPQQPTPFDVTFQYSQSEQLVSVFQNAPARPLKSFTYLGGKVKQATRQNYVVNPAATEEAVAVPVVSTFDYDGFGRVSRKTLNAGFEASIGYEYDSLGRLQFLQYNPLTGCNACLAGPTRRVKQGFSKDFVTSLTQTLPDARTYVSNVTYHPNLLVSERTRGNGVKDKVTIADGRPRPTQIQAIGGWDTQAYVYDGAGAIEAIGGDKYRYDRLGRITGMLVTGGSESSATLQQTYNYDIAGNLIAMNGLGGVTTPGATAIAVNPSTNRLPADWAEYDDAGNVIRITDSRRPDFKVLFHEIKNGNAVSWFDPENMPTRVEGYQTSPTTVLAYGRVFLYDADDERVAVQDYAAPGVDASPSVRELWTVRGVNNEVMREVERVHGTMNEWRWTKDYLYSGSSLIGAVLADVYDPSAPGTLHHYHTDHLGTIRYISNAAGGQVDMRKYWAFGDEVHARPDTNRKKFTGHERDDDGTLQPVGDLDYMHARYYGAALGRFLSVDPGRDSDSGAPQSWNLYAYVRNNPIGSTDPSGRETEGHSDSLVEVTFLPLYFGIKAGAFEAAISARQLEWNQNSDGSATDLIEAELSAGVGIKGTPVAVGYTVETITQGYYAPGDTASYKRETVARHHGVYAGIAGHKHGSPVILAVGEVRKTEDTKLRFEGGFLFGVRLDVNLTAFWRALGGQTAAPRYNNPQPTLSCYGWSCVGASGPR